MVEESVDAVRDSPPPASLRRGLWLVGFGVWLAVADTVADTVITVRLLTHTLDDSKLGELWLLAGVRALASLAGIALALWLRHRTLQRRGGARIGLIVLLCLFAAGGFANLVFTWIQLLGAAMGGDYAQPLEPWLNYLSLASMAADVLLIAVALVAALLLVLGRHPATANRRDVS